MIREPVVFVLGAGASIAYGYQSGETLVGGMQGLQSDVAQILQDLGYTEAQWGPFQEALKKAAPSSIDAFLEHRSDMRDLGKLLIASYILRCEKEDRLYPNEDHWYPMLVDKLDAQFDSLDFSNVTIVTFNYDRSLEQFLFQTLRNRHNKDCGEVANALSRLRIIHAYGHLGPLDWQAKGDRIYSPDLIADEVRKAAEGIKIISEGRDDSPELQQATVLIKEARHVFFLGMAYHPDNMRRLGFPLLPHEGRDRYISGSAFGLPNNAREFYRVQYRFTYVGATNEQCKMFLKNNPDFLGL